MGMGALALGSIVNEALGAGSGVALPELRPLSVRPPHFPAKAKRVIHLFMKGLSVAQ